MKNFQYATLIVISSVLCVSCQKDKVSKLPSYNIANHTLAAYKAPANPANLFDTAGYYHNLILSNILSCSNHTGIQDTTAINGCAIRFCNQIQYKFPLRPMPSWHNVVTNMNNDFRHVIDGTTNSAKVKVLLDSLIEIIKASAIQKNVSYATIKDKIESFENSVIANPGLTDVEKKAVLIPTSVARYSAYYWMIGGPSGQGLTFKKIVQWVGAVTSDVAGVLVSGNAQYAAECSSYAYFLILYSMPG